MAAALDELRRAVIAGHDITIDSSSVVINGSKRLDRSAPTNFRSRRGRGDSYPLDAVFFQFKHEKLPFNDYVQLCRKESISHVFLLDKKDLIAYLTGRIRSCVNLSSSAPDRPTAKSRLERASAAASSPPTLEAKESASVFPTLPIEEKGTATFSVNRKRDREQRSMDSVLITKDWDFSSLREKLEGQVVKSRDAPAGRENGDKNSSSQAYDPRGDRYTSNEDRFWRENLGSDFHQLGIDMSGSFKEKPAANAPNEPFSDKERSRDRSKSRSATKGPPGKRPRSAEDLVPIIIVPMGFSTLICHGNASDFFHKGRYVSVDQLKSKKVSSTSKVSREEFTRRPGGNCSSAKYQIVSNPKRLTVSDWEQVVAVVCSGQDWQFKGWPIFDGQIRDLFRRVQGFYFHYDDTPPPQKIESWAIQTLMFSRANRHTDSMVQSQFWHSLDAFLRKGKGKDFRY